MSITVYTSCTGFDKLIFIPNTSIFFYYSDSLITMSSAGYLLEF